jgi:hypothetical protein
MKKRPFQFTPNLPICDGIRYDELSLFPVHLQHALIGRKLVWLTEFEADGMELGGSVIARSREEAEKIADARGLSERVTQCVESYKNPPYFPGTL